MRRSPQRNRARTLLAALVALASAAGAAGLGTMAAGYSSAGSSSISVTTGSVAIGGATVDTAANRLTTSVSALEPGDTINRSVDLKNIGATWLSSVTLNTTDTATAPLLSTNTTGLHDGLQMTVQWCSTAWTESGTAPAYSYACAGGATSLIAARDVITTTPISLGSSLNAVNPASTLPTTDHLMITLNLPTSSPSAAQSAQSVINYTFTGTQPTARTR